MGRRCWRLGISIIVYSTHCSCIVFALLEAPILFDREQYPCHHWSYLLESVCHVACGGSSGRRFTDLTASNLEDERDYSIHIDKFIQRTLYVSFGLQFALRSLSTRFELFSWRGEKQKEKKKKKRGEIKKGAITKPQSESFGSAFPRLQRPSQADSCPIDLVQFHFLAGKSSMTSFQGYASLSSSSTSFLLKINTAFFHVPITPCSVFPILELLLQHNFMKCTYPFSLSSFSRSLFPFNGR